jgi:hypothetical protein
MKDTQASVWSVMHPAAVCTIYEAIHEASWDGLFQNRNCCCAGMEMGRRQIRLGRVTITLALKLHLVEYKKHATPSFPAKVTCRLGLTLEIVAPSFLSW